jgi:ribosomal protein S6E (S10)
VPGVGVFKGGPGWGTPASVLKEGMDQGLLAVTGGSAAKGSAMGLEVAGSGPVQLPFSSSTAFFLPPFFPTLCSPQ